MKRCVRGIVLVGLTILIFSSAGCGGQAASSEKPDPAPESEVEVGRIEPRTQMMKDLQRYVYMTKDEILKELGDGFEIVGTGPKKVLTGYRYAAKGLTFTFSEDDETYGLVSFVNCDSSVDINGAHAGMSITAVRQILGQVPIMKTWFETPDNETFCVAYWIGECRVEFDSRSGNVDSRDTIVCVQGF